MGPKSFPDLHEITCFRNEVITQVLCGKNFTFVLTDKNVLYGTGCNIYGVLGIDDMSHMEERHYNFTAFVRIPISFHIDRISCNNSLAVIVASGNYLGVPPKSNEHSEKKQAQTFFWSGGDMSVSGSPIIKQFTPIVDWSMNIKGRVKYLESSPTSKFFVIVTEFNRIYFSGVNCSGQFGNGEEKHSFKSLVPLSAGFFPPFYGIKHVACGTKHTVIVTDCNQLFTSGDNKYFQLGHSCGDKTNTFQKPKIDFQGTPIKMAKCGSFFTLVYLESMY